MAVWCGDGVGVAAFWLPAEELGHAKSCESELRAAAGWEVLWLGRGVGVCLVR